MKTQLFAILAVVGIVALAHAQTQTPTEQQLTRPSAPKADAPKKIFPLMYFQAVCGGKSVTWVTFIDEAGNTVIKRFEKEHAPVGGTAGLMERLKGVPGDTYALCN